MGNCMARIFRAKRIRRHIVLILIGLDNSGKSQTANTLSGETSDVLPTVGFKAINLLHRDNPVTIFDLGGGAGIRQIWPQYYSEVHGVIFVIDSSDFSRLDECRSVLEEVISHDKISGKPLLVLANKQDKQGALDDIDVVEKLNIEPLVNKHRCPTLVESYSAVVSYKSKKPKLDPGLKKGYYWLLDYIVRRYGDLNLRVQTDIHADLERRRRGQRGSDDATTQTGFENPNFDPAAPLKQPELIVVKPIKMPGSLDTTVTIETLDGSDNDVKPKLSPFFEKDTGDSADAVSRASPLKSRSGSDRHLDFKDRPQSSPGSTKEKDTCSGDSFSRGASTSSGSAGRAAARGALSERVDRKASSDIAPPRHAIATPSPRRAPATLPPRPASASALLRRQLELGAHKRRLSLRYVHRNRTAPQRAGPPHFEPAKSAPREMGDGEPPAPHSYLRHGDREL